MSDELNRKSALVVGASRGLGLGLSLEFLRRGWNVTATVRAASGSRDLEKYHGQITMDTLDINNLAMVDAFVDRVGSQVFDVVFLNAGIGGAEGKTVDNVSTDEVAHLVMTNAVAPVRLAGRLVRVVRPQTGILVFMSSILGSVSANVSGFAELYSGSKAMLNRLSREFSAVNQGYGFTVISMHPGWVRTDMGGPNADIDVETSAKGMVDVLEAKAGAGGHEFLNYKGETLPW